MKKRIFSTVVLSMLVALTFWGMGILGGVFLLALCSTLAQLELYQLMEKIGWRPQKKSATAMGTIVLLESFFSGRDFLISNPSYPCPFQWLPFLLFFW